MFSGIESEILSFHEESRTSLHINEDHHIKKKKKKFRPTTIIVPVDRISYCVCRFFKLLKREKKVSPTE